MNENTAPSTTVATGETTVELSTEQPQNNVRYITPAQLKQIKSEERHRQNVLKKRQQRWSEPAANAKVEDIMLIAQDIQTFSRTLDALNSELYLMRTALFNAGLLQESDLKALRERQKEREAKFKELQENTTMLREEKIAIANEYELPLQLLGLQDEAPASLEPAPTGDVQ